MRNAWWRLRTRPYFLLRYFSLQLLISGVLILLEFTFRDVPALFRQPVSFSGLWWLPLGLIAGVKIPVWMHNSVHGNLRPRFLNPIVGELAGVYILLGREAFALNHAFHHAYADTDDDPHNPHRKTFFRFLLANNFGGTAPVRRKYLEFHGDTSHYRRVFGTIVVLHFLNAPLRLAFWILLLGPSLFLTLFAPSYLFHLFVFAHINFVTHATAADGKSVVRNLDSNLYYRAVNRFGNGVYYHRNHHRAPRLADPRRLAE